MIFVSYILDTFREAISDQISDYRNTLFSKDQRIVCEITGLEIPRKLCDIDHKPPLTLEQLAFHFVCKHLDGKLLDYSDIKCLSDSTTLREWQIFHEERSILRPVYKRCNQRLPKSKCDWILFCDWIVIVKTSEEADEMLGKGRLAITLKELKSITCLPPNVSLKHGVSADDYNDVVKEKNSLGTIWNFRRKDELSFSENYDPMLDEPENHKYFDEYKMDNMIELHLMQQDW